MIYNREFLINYSKNFKCIKIKWYKYIVLNKLKDILVKYIFFSKKEEENFYNSIKNSLSYSILTKKGVVKKMFFKQYKKLL